MMVNHGIEIDYFTYDPEKARFHQSYNHMVVMALPLFNNNPYTSAIRI
jgi:hypothetical protein